MFIFLPGCITRGCGTGIHDTYFHKNTVFFWLHLLYEIAKKIRPGVYTGIFRQFTPKIHCFSPYSFLPGCTLAGHITIIHATIFPKNVVFFRIHTLRGDVKVCLRMYIPAIFDNLTLNVLFCSGIIFVRLYILGLLSRIYITYPFLKPCFLP